MSAEQKILGPYRLLKPLGQGGSGIVWRAEHAGTGLPVALKTVRVPNAALLASIRREVAALARIEHPGIVRILEHGLADGVPWYAMELVEGTTLLGHCLSLQAHGDETETEHSLLQPDTQAGPAASASAAVAAPDRRRGPLSPAALGRILTALRRLCGPLAFLHGEGLVHRDLKPGNVMVRPNGRPVLVDFGLAAQFSGRLSREALDLTTAPVGTAAYMAPEQIRAELVDARSDLYALGCMLYELLAGRAPFTGASAREILMQHLKSQPVPVSKLVPEVPAGMDELLLRLLAKSPRERLGYAEDVAAALLQLGARDEPLPGPEPRSYLYRPGFAGRDDSLSQLEGCLHALDEGRGSVVLITGESGVGKTRLAIELAHRAAQGGVLVLTGECLPGSSQGQASGVPFEALRKPLQQLADRCRERGLAEAERLFGPRGKLLAPFEPALAALPGQDAYPEPAELPGEAAQLRLFLALAETLAALAAHRGVLLLLDDLQWADELTSGFLDLLVRTERLQQTPLLVVGTCRSEEMSEALRPLMDAPGTGHIALGRLTEPAVASICADMLALAPPPRQLSRFLHFNSEGNPFFVAEYLRAAVVERMLWRDQSGLWRVAESTRGEAGTSAYEGLGLPHSLRELVGRRLGALPAAAASLAAAAAVLGRESDSALLQHMHAVEEEAFGAALDVLVRIEILEPIGTDRMRFVHDKLHEVAYERLPAARRRELHRAAAEGIEQHSGPARLERLAELGRHWELAGEPQKAAPRYLQAARKAMRQHEYAEGARLYRVFLGLGAGRGDEELEARLGLAECLEQRGHVPDAGEELRRAVARARELDDEALELRAQSALATVLHKLGQMDEARELYEDLVARGRTAPDQTTASALAGLAVLHTEQSRYAESQHLSEQSMQLFSQLGERSKLAQVMGNLAVGYHYQGRLDEARRLYEQALAIDRALGERPREGHRLGCLAVLAQEQGRLEEATSLLEQALAISQEVDDRRTEGILRMNLGALQLDSGRLEAAMEAFEQALALHQLVGNRPWLAITTSSLGMASAEQGRVAEARACYERTLEITRELRDRRFEAITHQRLALLDRRLGSFDQAARWLDLAEAVLEELGESLHLAFCLCERGHLALASGRSAKRAAARARRLAAGLKAGPRSPLAGTLDRLRRAQEAREEGKPLFRGERVEDIPEGLRRYLRETGQLAGFEEASR
jgi:eukaryotic-like serine/threonine-protein kinase